MTGLWDVTVYLLTDQKKIKDNYKDPDMLPKIIEAVMVGMLEAIKEYLRSHHVSCICHKEDNNSPDSW